MKRAFTIIELLVITVIVVALLVLVGSAMRQGKQRAQRETCSNNLKSIALAFKTSDLDSWDNFLTGQGTNIGGAKEYVLRGEVFRAFSCISNELGSPEVLVCPADERKPAPRFGVGFSNTNVSYFASLNAGDISPQMFLSGDRNLTNGPLSPNRLLLLNTNYPAGWMRGMHFPQGNIVLSDGSVQQFSITRLKTALSNCWWQSNALAFP